jgi:transcriptional regulator of acetoin/glycerol metabolism
METRPEKMNLTPFFMRGSGRPVAEVARELGIPRNRLYKRRPPAFSSGRV